MVETWQEIVIFPVNPAEDGKISNVREAEGIMAEEQGNPLAEIVEHERQRLVRESARYGVLPEHVKVEQRDDIAIIWAARDPNGALVSPLDEKYVDLGEGNIQPLVQLQFHAPYLVAMVKRDGTVVRGTSEEVREVYTSWVQDDLKARYMQRLEQAGQRIEEAMRRGQ